MGVIFHLPPDTSDNANPPLNDVKWRHQPKLRYLELEGIILDCRQDEFYAFLAVDRPNLSGLILRVHLPNYTNLTYRERLNLGVAFPNLASFGVEIGTLLVEPLPPAPNMSITDLILFFTSMNYDCDAETTMIEILESTCKMCHEWMPQRIVLSTTWEAEEQFMKGFKLSTSMKRPKLFYLPHYVQFFQVSKEEGIMVVDREGQSAETIDGRRYIDSLKMHGLDKYDNGLKVDEEWEVVRPRAAPKSVTTRYGYTMSRTRGDDSD